MTRVVGVLALVFLVAGGARADVPPPEGQKRVTLDNKVATETDCSDFAFFLHSGGDRVEPVKLDPMNPLVISGAGRKGSSSIVRIVAVPRDAAGKYDSETAFHEAVAKGEVEGWVAAKAGFYTWTTIQDTDPRKTVTAEYKLEKIDPREGLVLVEVKADEETSALRTGPWVAGLALALALILAGAWVARRNRR